MKAVNKFKLPTLTLKKFLPVDRYCALVGATNITVINERINNGINVFSETGHLGYYLSRRESSGIRNEKNQTFKTQRVCRNRAEKETIKTKNSQSKL